MAYEHNGLAAALELVNGLHYGRLVEGIERAGGFVEQDERRVVEEDAREADALALAARKRVAQLGNRGVETLRQAVDEGGKRSGAAGMSSSASDASERATSRFSRTVPQNRCVSWVI